MQYLERLIFLTIILITAISCEKGVGQNKKDYFIEWDNNSLVCIADEGGYPRLIRMLDKSFLAVYENRKGDVVIKKSLDNGTNWKDEVVSFEALNYANHITGGTTKVNIANPEIIQLPSGDLLLAVNLRPQIEGVFPFSIALKRSSDNGATWSESQILFQAAAHFKDGCWEPSFLLLPDGTIQIYFANEFPYLQSNEQEISVLTSTDNGYTWDSEPKTVSFRNGHRDGMPVAVHDGESIYLVIEDNVSGQFKPWLLSSPINKSWESPILADSQKRCSALKNNLPDTVYAGAPYMIRLNNGIYLISYQTTEGRTSNWELSTMEVVLSDKPYDFRNPSQPFDVPLNKEAKWNALSYLGDNTIAALASTNFNSEKIGVWMIKGKIILK